ncbi:MAG: hypothetical protein RR683_01825, partial [Lachnospiraceae bacterium]
RRKIYTIEELCYYLCNHLYLIDYTIMNTQLCDWIGEELELDELAERLRTTLEHHGSMERFVLEILTASHIYTAGELTHIQSVLEKLKNQKDIERKKFKADNLLESGETEAAILVYQELIHEERDETVDEKFYGKVYGCLGAAFGRVFLYEEAAKMYEEAFQICQEESMLSAYLYACYRYLPREEYYQLLKKSPVYALMDVQIQETIKKSKEVSTVLEPKRTLEEWKTQYRSSWL